MLRDANGPESRAIPPRLKSPVSVAVALSVPREEALRRLRAAIDISASVEHGSQPTDRRLTGEVSEEVVRLSVADANWTRRRQGWNIEFRGRIESGPRHGALRGVVEIANTNRVRPLLWLVRVAAVVPFFFGIASLMSRSTGDPVQIGPLIFGAAITVLALLAVYLLESSVESAAADDANSLTNYLRSQVG